jgi:hypothetical protein
VLFAIVTVADENPAHGLSVCYHFLLFKAKIRRLFSSIHWVVEGHEAPGRTTSRLRFTLVHEGSRRLEDSKVRQTLVNRRASAKLIACPARHKGHGVLIMKKSE